MFSNLFCFLFSPFLAIIAIYKVLKMLLVESSCRRCFDDFLLYTSNEVTGECSRCSCKYALSNINKCWRPVAPFSRLYLVKVVVQFKSQR